MTELRGDQPCAPGAGLPQGERLVNLTEHMVAVDSLMTAPGRDDGAPVPSTATFAPEGQLARVADDQAQLSDGWLNTPGGLVKLAHLRRRPGSVTGLPAAEPGVRYLVSRITALAVRDRADLVFPFGELRDGQGRVTGVTGLAAFRPGAAVRGRYRDWQARSAERRSGRPLTGEWRTGLLFALATALLSAWLGLLPGTVDNAVKNGWAGNGQGWTSWLTVAFLVLGALALTGAARRWYSWQRVRADRGTAYVIEEEAISWRHEEKQWVLAELAGGFARVLRVPGPEALGERWRWQADARGAQEWDRRTDQLVQSFWAVHYNDDQVTRNAVFVWAPWPVSMAFGARATARRRGLVLHVRQRPSSGVVGRRHELRLEDQAHDFLRGGEEPGLDAGTPDRSVKELTGRIAVTITALGSGSSGLVSRLPRLRDKAFPRVRLLLVRIVQEAIGRIPLDLAMAPAITLHAPGCLTGAVLRPGRHQMEVAEWRLVGTGNAAEVPWRAFPAVAEAIAAWITKQAEQHAGQVLLLATRMPQEIAVGLGIQLGQRQSAWPRRLYPVHYVGGELIVPNLDLGRDSVRPERD
jgi:hypothetical protein